jgi:hypothetical protein
MINTLSLGLNLCTSDSLIDLAIGLDAVFSLGVGDCYFHTDDSI